MLRMVLIAPRTNLNFVDNEIEGLLRSGFEILPILGNITFEKLSSELNKVENVDILWVATHISNDGQIILGETGISIDRFTSLVKGKFKLIYLNTCESLTLAQQIQNDCDSAVICTVGSIEDVDAYQTGITFAKLLIETRNVEYSYQQSKPTNNNTYIFLGSLRNSKMFGDDQQINNQAKELQELTKAFYKLDATLNTKLIIMKQRLSLLEENNRHLSDLVNVYRKQENNNINYPQINSREGNNKTFFTVREQFLILFFFCTMALVEFYLLKFQ